MSTVPELSFCWVVAGVFTDFRDCFSVEAVTFVMALTRWYPVGIFAMTATACFEESYLIFHVKGCLN